MKKSPQSIDPGTEKEKRIQPHRRFFPKSNKIPETFLIQLYLLLKMTYAYEMNFREHELEPLG